MIYVVIFLCLLSLLLAGCQQETSQDAPLFAAAAQSSVFLYILLALAALEIVLAVVFFTAQQRESRKRKQAEQEVKHYQTHLESLVQERTAELEQEIRERKRTEEALRESEDRYKTMYNGAPVMLHSIDHQGRLISVSDYWLKVMGYTRDDVLGRKSTEFLTEDSRRYAETVTLPAFYKTGWIQDVPYQLIKKNGEIIEVLMSAISEKDEQGKFVRSLAVIIDITDRKQAEEALTRSKAEFEAMFTSNTDAVIFVNPQRQIVLTNPAFTKMFGYTLEEVCGRTTAFLYASQEEYEAQGRQRYHSGMEWDQRPFEIFYRRKNGALFPAESLGVQVKDAQGQLLGFLGIHRDIADRKQAEQALQVERDNLRAIMTSMPVAILVLDETEQVTDANPAAQRLFKRSLDELKRRRCGDVLGCVKRHDNPDGCGNTPDCPDCNLDAAIKAVLRTGQGVYRRETEMVLDSVTGHMRRWLSFSIEAVQIDRQRRVILALNDITDRKQAEEELKQYHQIVSTTPDGVSLVDREYRYKIVNDAYERFSDMKREQLLGLSLAEYLGEEVFQQYVKPHFDRCLQGETIQYGEWFDYPTLGRRFAQITYFPYRDAQNTITGVVANTRDLTELKEAEEQIRASLKEKEVLLREIHHRVKNNLMVVTALIQMQAEQTSEPTALALFRDLYNRVLAMSMVHEDLYQSESLASIDFHAYLQRLVSNIRQGFAQTPAAVVVEAEGIFLDVHYAIPCGLIVAELVTNAFKYAFPPSPPAPLPKGEGSTPSPLVEEGWGEGETLPSPFGRGAGGEGSVIRVEMRKDDNTYTLIISDNGVGLPPNFDLRTSKTLGMSLVRSWTMHQLKGKIKVDRQTGAKFIVIF